MAVEHLCGYTIETFELNDRIAPHKWRVNVYVHRAGDTEFLPGVGGRSEIYATRDAAKEDGLRLGREQVAAQIERDRQLE